MRGRLDSNKDAWGQLWKIFHVTLADIQMSLRSLLMFLHHMNWESKQENMLCENARARPRQAHNFTRKHFTGLLIPCLQTCLGLHDQLPRCHLIASSLKVYETFPCRNQKYENSQFALRRFEVKQEWNQWGVTKGREETQNPDWRSVTRNALRIIPWVNVTERGVGCGAGGEGWF